MTAGRRIHGAACVKGLLQDLVPGPVRKIAPYQRERGASRKTTEATQTLRLATWTTPAHLMM
jgi:hypothetical protein